MTFLAPRQGLFAIIILVSLCLHTLFFVLSEKHESTERQRVMATQSTSELVRQLKVPMATDDRISMSVIADKYTKEEEIAFVGVYDAKDVLLVPVGVESADGLSLKESVVSGTTVLGSVVVKTPAVGYVQVISKHWLFLLGVVGLHTILWLLYGYLARPTRQMCEVIGQKVRMELLDKGILQQQFGQTVGQSDATNTSDDDPNLQANISSVTSILHKTKPADSTTANNDVLADDKNSTSDCNDGCSDGYVVQILFEDPNHLLSAISHDSKMAYFALCDQLLDQAVLHLLELPLLAGVTAKVVKYYDDKGAKVILYGIAPAKAATAAVFLSKLMLMLNQVVYDKHREIKRFTWQIRTTVSDGSNADAVLDLTKRRRESPMILLDESAQNEVKIYAELMRLDAPMSVYERESCSLASVTRATAERLRSVRDKVLLGD
ncbi:hypothetical protein [Moraxella sp. Pampa]|uniref:hypothetical protein n=1 Tax=Moraxella sp. Pampa TaxID=3111978 RepID=UPI002B40743A|nr:hypothetical protein [Moraxella sp. Pampa]